MADLQKWASLATNGKKTGEIGCLELGMDVLRLRNINASAKLNAAALKCFNALLFLRELG